MTQNLNIKKIEARISENPSDFVTESESAFKKQITNIGTHIAEKKTHIIFLAGPSSSGKTTTAKMLAEELSRLGKKVDRISLDNFYKGVDSLTRWKNGQPNYESIKGLDLDYLAVLLKKLQETGKADFPIFDFTQKKRGEKTFSVEMAPGNYLIFEGIHAINPKITDMIASDECAKLYISVNSDFVDEENNVALSGRELRLIRRILRDGITRATSPAQVFEMWEGVALGEKHYIHPTKKHAETLIDSVHYYEPNLYRNFLLSVLEKETIPKQYQNLENRLKTAVERFTPLDLSLIPKTSLLREFIPSISENN